MTSIKLTDRITKSNLFDEDNEVFTKKSTNLAMHGILVRAKKIF